MKNKHWVVLILSVVLATVASGAAVYTTDVTGTTVNINSVAAKTDVYLTGGPSSCGGSGLPDGTYYFEVTDPPAKVLLSSDAIVNRTFTVSGGAGVINGYTGNHSVPGSTGCGSLIIQLMPFANTPNGGGVYKMTVSDASCTTFDNSGLMVSSGGCFSKSDNFRVGVTCTVNCGGVPPSSLISGVKFYDANDNHIFDPSESGIANWEIDVTYTFLGTLNTAQPQSTDSGGNWAVLADQGTSLTACEVMKPNYQQTYPGSGTVTFPTGFSPSLIGSVYCWTGTVPASDTTGLNFGNIATVSGTKYYDTNANGVPDTGGPTPEPTITGFKVLSCMDAGCPSITTSQFTDVNGKYSFFLPTPTSTYTVCEVLPPPRPTWVQTGPLKGASPIGNLGSGTASANTVKCWMGSGPANGLYLTNVCYVTTGALTLGWYKNAGNSTITSSDLATLVALNLSNGTAINNFNPTTDAQVKTWLSGATATNMGYMLSVQLAVMQLNIDHSFIGASVLIYAPGTNSANAAGFATLSAVMNEANTLLGTDGIINAGDPNRTRAGALETALDNANNNLNIVGGPGQCLANPIAPY